ncbi:MAG: DUF1559 domain-containing protein, partial [Planctomycetaceae bacterium]|nr:DUF1559 domain-containing protein [Planctomycetaceae bacterium]
IQKSLHEQRQQSVVSDNASIPELETSIPNGITYRECLGRAFYLPNPTTLILGPREDVKTALDNPKPAELVHKAIQTGMDQDALLLLEMQDPLRVAFKGPALLLGESIPGAGKWTEQLESVSVFLDLYNGLSLKLIAQTNTEAAPQTMELAYNKGQETLGPIIASEFPRRLTKDLGEEFAKFTQQVFAESKVEVEGQQISVTLRVPRSAEELLQKVAKVQQEQAKALIDVNRFKILGVAAHNFLVAYDCFPFPSGNHPNMPITQKDKLSWRVHLLPFLDEYELYEKFHLDESWDSEHNKTLLEQMPEIYKLSDQTQAGRTQFVVPVGPGFFGEKGEIQPSDIAGGLSRTIVAVTVVPEKAMPWTQPGGFKLDPEKAKNILGGQKNGFLALFADGLVRTLDSSMEPAALKARLTISGNEKGNARGNKQDRSANREPSR